MDFGRDGIRLKNGDVTIFDKSGEHTRATYYCPFCGSEIEVLEGRLTVPAPRLCP